MRGINTVGKQSERGVFGAGQKKEYCKKVRQVLGSSIVAYYPRIYDGQDISGHGYDGIPANLTTVAGIGDGMNGAGFNGSNSKLDTYTTAFRANFPYTEGYFSIWVQPTTWVDSDRRIMRFLVDANNYIQITKLSSGVFEAIYISGGVTLSTWYPSAALTRTDMFNISMSWSKTNNRMRFYFDGHMVSENTGTLATWAGIFNDSNMNIGLQFIVNYVFSGSMAHAIFGSGEPTPYILQALSSKKVRNFTRISGIGDSIMTAYGGWFEQFGNLYGNGNSRIVKHSVNSTRIIGDMATQVANAADDNASLCLVNMGTNDIVTDDTLRSTYETNINTYKASNPNATIYCLAIMPRTDMTNVDTKNGLIHTACTNAGVKFVDTSNMNHGGVTFDPAVHTSDGLHPNDAGKALIANWTNANIGSW